MRYKNCLIAFLFSAISAMLLLPGSAEGKTRRVVKKPVAVKTSSTAKASDTARKGKRQRGRKTAASAKRTGAARQTAPTAERYMQIQQALAEKGHYDGPIDGMWNASCVDALKRFQQEQGLVVDGKLGSLSLIALGLGPKREPMQQLLGKPEAQGDLLR